MSRCYLLKAGANVNTRFSMGSLDIKYAALHVVTANDDAEGVRFLLDECKGCRGQNGWSGMFCIICRSVKKQPPYCKLAVETWCGYK